MIGMILLVLFRGKYIEFCKSKFDNEMAYTKYWENEIIND